MRRPRPKLRHVMLDESFIDALLATDAPQHTAACELYSRLVDRYQAGTDRLYALSTVLGELPTEFRRNALAPVLRLNVARQHRSAAARMGAELSPSTALTLVMMRRERVRTVAAASHAFDGLAIDVLAVDVLAIDDGEATMAAEVASGHVALEPAELSSRTGSPSAPRPTDE